MFQVTDRSEALKNRQRKKAGNKNRTWQHLLLLFLSCCCFHWVGSGVVGTMKFSVLHHKTSCQSLTSLFILPCFKQFFGDEATTSRICIESNIKLSDYINIWNRNVNIYWRWSCHNSSYGFCVKLSCQPMILCTIFIMVASFVRMPCLQVRYCFLCVAMCWCLRMRRISMLGILQHIVFSQFYCFLQQSYGLGLRFRFCLNVDLVLYCLAPQRLSFKTQSKIWFLGPLAAVEKCLYKTLG